MIFFPLKELQKFPDTFSSEISALERSQPQLTSLCPDFLSIYVCGFACVRLFLSSHPSPEPPENPEGGQLFLIVQSHLTHCPQEAKPDFSGNVLTDTCAHSTLNLITISKKGQVLKMDKTSGPFPSANTHSGPGAASPRGEDIVVCCIFPWVTQGQ